MVQTQNLHFSLISTTDSPPCFTKTTFKKTLKKQTESKRPYTSHAQAQKKVFVTYSPPKSDDWTPPWDPPRSPQKVPKPTRGAPETPQSSPRALQDPQDVLGVTKPHENQQKRKENKIKPIKTTENQWESNETFNNIKLHARIGDFNWC